MTARVALGISSDEEIHLVLAHAIHCDGCRGRIAEIARAASAVAGPFCLSREEILRSTDMPVAEEDDEHLRSCNRCSSIGFKIVHLPASEHSPGLMAAL